MIAQMTPLLCILLGFSSIGSGQDIDLLVSRRSIHLGETVSCYLELTPKGVAKVKNGAPLVLWDVPHPILKIPLRPESIGRTALTPFELNVQGVQLCAEEAWLEVLPPLGTNVIAELRIHERTIRKDQTLQVIFQWQRPTDFPALTNLVPLPTVSAKDNGGGLGWVWDGPPWAKAGDWEVNIRVDRSDLSRSVASGSSRYLLDAGFQVYTLRPLHAGQLEITKKTFEVFPVQEVFRTLPPLFKIEPTSILVEETSNQAPEDTARKLADPQH